MPPVWKIGRELKRLGAKVPAAPGYFVRWFAATAYYDRVLARERRTSEGNLPSGPKVAVYVIFPKNGLRPSHLRSLRHLRTCGYAPLVVANHPLAEGDRTQLLNECFRLIERANFGYDFGGYRDGVLSISEALPALDRLVLINDSTWFPLPGTADWVTESEDLGVDYAGAVWTGAVSRVAPPDFEKILWQVDKSRRNFHYASFALNIAAPILRDPGFLLFWQRLRLSQDKNRTVRRGEIGLTRWVMARGYSHGATAEFSDLDQRLRAMDDAAFWAFFRSAIIYDDAELSSVAADVAQSAPGDRVRHEKLLLTAVSRRGASYALADYLVRVEKVGFLKKGPARLTGHSAGVIAALARDLGEAGAEILDEIARAG